MDLDFESMGDDELVQLRNKASEEYYGADVSTELTLSDEQFDQLTKVLDSRNIESPVGHGYEPDPDAEMIQHEIPMLSLGKVRNGNELHSWVSKVLKEHGPSVTFLTQLKYDGIAVSVVYYNGELQSVSKRGNGYIGEDVTKAARAIASIPNKIDIEGQVEVRGEVVITFDAFKRLAAEYGYENIRSTASGILNRKDGREAENLTFVAYSLMANQAYVQNEILELSSRSFITPTDHYQFLCNYSELPQSILTIKRQEIQGRYPFEIDGAVIKVVDVELRKKLGSSPVERPRHPNWAVAYKYPDTDHVTYLNGVEWQVGSTGRVVPVAQVEMVTIDGAAVSRCSLHNIGVLENLDIRIGDRVRVRRANKVIPEITGRATEEHAPDSQEIIYPSLCPQCQAPIILSENEETGKRDLLCSNAYNTGSSCSVEQMILRSIEAFNIKYIGFSFVSKVLETYPNVTSFLDLIGMTEEEFSRLPGVDTFAKKAHDNLSTVWNQNVCWWIAAMGIPGIASASADKLDEYIGGFQEILDADREQLAAVPGFGYSKADAVIKGKPVIQEWMNKLITRYNWVPKPWGQAGWDSYYRRDIEVVEESRWSGKRVVITGTLSSEMTREVATQWVYDQGAINVGKNITQTTDIVIMGSNPSEHKETTARRLAEEGQLIIVEQDEFISEVNDMQ